MDGADPSGARRLSFDPLDRDHRDRELSALAWLDTFNLAPRPVGSSSFGSSSFGSSSVAIDALGSGGSTRRGARWEADEETLWFDAPPGCPADWAEIRVQPGAVVEALGHALARLHALPAAGASAPSDLTVLDPAELVGQAAERVRRGLVDPTNFEQARSSLAPGRLLDQADALLPLLSKRAERTPVRLVPTHGAARPGAFWLDQGQLRALLGVSGLALSDPYRDLAAASRWLVSNVSGEALPAFFSAYGLPDPDPIRLEFHVLLDELR